MPSNDDLQKVHLAVMAEFREGVEERREPTYVNMDARFLIDLAVEMDGGEEPDPTTVRLRTIASHIERMDNRLAGLTANSSAYEAGIVEGKRRYLERSNLPLQPVELSPNLRAAIAASKVPVTKVPTGKMRAPVVATPLTLAGIKLNFSGLKKEG